jgi:hypothetical protein
MTSWVAGLGGMTLLLSLEVCLLWTLGVGSGWPLEIAPLTLTWAAWLAVAWEDAGRAAAGPADWQAVGAAWCATLVLVFVCHVLGAGVGGTTGVVLQGAGGAFVGSFAWALRRRSRVLERRQAEDQASRIARWLDEADARRAAEERARVTALARMRTQETLHIAELTWAAIPLGDLLAAIALLAEGDKVLRELPGGSSSALELVVAVVSAVERVHGDHDAILALLTSVSPEVAELTQRLR